MLKRADGPASASPAIESTELIQSRRCYPRFAVSVFPSYRPHTEALGSSAHIRCVSPSCWRYRVASKSASKAARITQMLRRIVRNRWRRGIGSCVSKLKRANLSSFQREIYVYFLKLRMQSDTLEPFPTQSCISLR
jgi:hypothetical protein